MYIKNIKIKGVAGIDEIILSLSNGMNILCGPNGVGKTTILECIAHTFGSMYGSSILKRNVAHQEGTIHSTIQEGEAEYKQTVTFDTYLPNVTTYPSVTSFELSSIFLISIKTTRTFVYKELTSITKDTDKRQDILIDEAANGIRYEDIKNWFVNRYLYSKHENALTPEQLQNFELAKDCLSILNPKISFSRVTASDNEILVNTPKGEIYYEYLSSGFKSVFAIIFGIIKEIEFRFKENKIIAKNFNGIILIDEVEIHLHPEWQEKIVNILTEIFPNAQFIVTTHSPHIIQIAEPNQIIALGYDACNRVSQRELPSSNYGFKGWTIEEVLSDVMGMTNLRTEVFNSILEDFGKAIDLEDNQRAEDIYRQIDDMLHPQNELRKLLKFQLIGIK